MADKKSDKKTTDKSKALKGSVKSYAKEDYYKMNEAEIIKAVAALREDVATLKRGTISGEVQNVHAYSARRKDLARALTALNTAREVK